jgi:hypothetical protein
MSRIIWLACILLIIHWIIQWRLAEWKVKEIQQASEHIERKLDEVTSELDGILLRYIEDAEVLERVKAHLNDK